MVGASNSISNLSATLGRLGNAFQRVQGSTAPLATGQRINRAADDPSGLISSENLAAVLEALEAEAYTLRRVDTIASTADGYLSAASDLLVVNAGLEVQLSNTAGLAPGEAEALRNQFAANQQAVTRITNSAAFNGVKLFNGTYSLQVGGGRLELPNLASSVPTQQALATLRGEIGAFQKNIVSSRLQVVEQTIQSTAQTRSMIRDTDYAQQTAELLRNQTLAQASTAAAGIAMQQASLGSLLDITA
ncbi:flagellin [Algisphaera agarilytica]|uniref:Flagellin n=2 Tax=Algisphaera agarilytica TaxID=1385975 RepID=A0A7X0LL85_9BACT|nr:flagellin [Algisphaera agarilytica]